jgi:hypothetical protein
MSRRRIWLGGAALFAFAGCGTEELNCGSPPDLSGDWSYDGVQSAPAATLIGGMTLERDGTCRVSGTISLTVDDGDGTPAMVSGPVYGSFLDEDNLELVAELDGERTHAGTLVADTISGEWAELSGSGRSGTFRAERSTP